VSEPKFDAGKVADLAKQIDAEVANIAVLTVSAKTARDELNSAETRLRNLEIELTKAVDGHLDRGSITGVRRIDQFPA
jgi:hypothetical protein